MTFPPTLPTDPADLYAMMGAEALLTHIEAAAAALAKLGVEITADAQRGLDELSECVVEHHARTDPAALARHVAKARAALRVMPEACVPHGACAGAASNSNGAAS